ncbi:MAG: PSD1 and planctomycete cytochrome C domain-containing protein [Fimbriiglobus sp.]
MGISFGLVMWACSLGSAEEPTVSFNRDVRPILSNHCYKCHGPATQKAGVRLDSLEAAHKKDAIVPNKPAESTILERIRSDDADIRMPPPETGPALTAKEIQILEKWIQQGAKYEAHWAFVKPTATEPLNNQHPVDRFIHQKLKAEGFKPAPEADRRVLIRRVTLDLIGLLPSPKEVEEYVQDTSPEAYDKLVDRLLTSPHYGERQARHWLDLARYADSNGYTIDGARSIWPYRDWVIEAFNADMPFDQFTKAQLAGDLLPNRTQADRVATGFHRNTSYNEEGGTDPEQFRVERTVDRTNTTGVVWLGLTVGCAQCHDHKYDPISQKEYFQLYAFFNSLDEPSLAIGGDAELEKKINDKQAEANKLKGAGKLVEGQKVEAEIKKLQGKVPSTLILAERKATRPTHIQIRGDFLRPGDVVKPSGIQAINVPISATKPTRLDLANWLTSPDHPLTSRVVVNRAWQQFFGKGIVETENDFGMQGRQPSHPELLDDLAVRFIRDGWSMKKLHRLMVTSATYRQSSHDRPELNERDPQNYWLARQNRLRVEAEIIRDITLTASGKLSRKLGGPGVYPPLPAEVFSFTQSKKAWPESQGENRFRRGIYTYIWRQSQHHLLTTFDGADAQTSCSRRNRSNTPLQALHMANDPAIQELATALGERVVKEAKESTPERIRFLFEVALSRPPRAEELSKLETYAEKLGASQTTTWAKLARVLFNLDEFITRE